MALFEVDMCRKAGEICNETLGSGPAFFTQFVDQIGYTYQVLIDFAVFRTTPGCKLSHQSILIEVDNH